MNIETKRRVLNEGVSKQKKKGMLVMTSASEQNTSTDSAPAHVQVARESDEFGRDLALFHEVNVTGRKVGASRRFWAALAHDRATFQNVVHSVSPGTCGERVIEVGVNYHLDGMTAYRQARMNHLEFIEGLKFLTFGSGHHQVNIGFKTFYRWTIGEINHYLATRGLRHVNPIEFLALKGASSIGLPYEGAGMLCLGSIALHKNGKYFALRMTRENEPMFSGGKKDSLNLLPLLSPIESIVSGHVAVVSNIGAPQHPHQNRREIHFDGV